MRMIPATDSSEVNSKIFINPLAITMVEAEVWGSGCFVRVWGEPRRLYIGGDRAEDIKAEFQSEYNRFIESLENVGAREGNH